MSVRQLTFLTPEIGAGAKPKPDKKGIDYEAIKQLAFLYTGTEAGSFSGIRFMMSVEDAMTWCESDISKGVLYGVRWAYFWTSVYNYLFSAWGETEIDTSRLFDNGEWDDRIAALGLKKISIFNFDTILGPLGVKVYTRLKRPVEET